MDGTGYAETEAISLTWKTFRRMEHADEVAMQENVHSARHGEESAHELGRGSQRVPVYLHRFDFSYGHRSNHERGTGKPAI